MNNACSPFLIFGGLVIGQIFIVLILKNAVYGVFLALGLLRCLTFSVWEDAALFTKVTPIEVVGKVVAQKETETLKYLTLDPDEITIENQKVTLHSKNWLSVQVPHSVLAEEGDILYLQGETLPPTQKMNPSDNDTTAYLRANRIVGSLKAHDVQTLAQKASWLVKIRSSLKNQIQNIFTHQDNGIITALILGDKTELAEETYALYQAVGIAHLLALSGFHMGIIYALFLGVASRIGLSYTPRFVVTLAGLWGYLLLIENSTSSLRAVIFLTYAILAKLLWEETDHLTTLAVSAAFILIGNPLQITQVGFLLSFGAVAGVALGQTVFELLKRDIKNLKYRPIFEMVCVFFGVQVGIAPLLACFFYVVPFSAGLLNFLVIPFFSVLVPAIYVVLMISFVSLPFAKFLAMLLIKSLSGITYLGEKALLLPWSTVWIGKPSWLAIFIFYGLIVFSVWLWQKKMRLNLFGVALPIVALVIVLGVSMKFPKPFYLMQLYVGQGDSAVWHFPSGQTVLMDVGTEAGGETVLNYLKYKGIQKVDAVILSHSDVDHSGGLKILFENGVSVGQVFLPAYGQEGTSLETIKNLARQRQVPITFLAQGDRIQFSDATLTCLWPQAGFYSESNDASLVCQLDYQDFKILYTGDISQMSEAALLPFLEPVTVLKVAHHGSKTSTSEPFILKTTPKYGMISYGKSNRYGHPHAQTLTTLKAQDILVYETGKDGAICLTLKDTSLRITAQCQREEE